MCNYHLWKFSDTDELWTKHSSPMATFRIWVSANRLPIIKDNGNSEFNSTSFILVVPIRPDRSALQKSGTFVNT